MSESPLRVLQVVRVMDRAGIETWLMHLLRYFDRREVALDFLVYSDQPGAHDDEIRSLGARIFRCASPRNPVRYALDFLRILRGAGPWDVVHSHNYFFAGVDVWLASLAGVKTRVAHMHPVTDTDSRRTIRSFPRPLYRRLMGALIRRYATLVLAPSNASLASANRFVPLGSKPQAVILNSVDTAAFQTPLNREAVRRELGIPVDLPLIAYVARFQPHKNHIALVELAERLERAGLRAHYAVAGTDGPSRTAFERRISGRQDFSVFVNRPDLRPLLRCADLFFFPSLEEGFGTVAIEAAAAGLPVVATSLPAIREACCEAQRAFLFAPGDMETAARNAHAILSSPSLARELVSEGKRWAEQFAIQTIAERLQALYGRPHRAAPVFEAAVA